MNTILHLALKDVRRLSGALAIFALVLATKWLVGLILISGDAAPTLDSAEFIQFFQIILVVVDLVLTGLIVVAVIHEDPVVGTEANWLTRPIRPIQMLLAKAASLAVMLGLLPVAVTLPWWVSNGFTASQLMQASLQTVSVNAGIVLFALPFAVLTRSTRGFVLSVIGLLVVWQAAFGLVRVVVHEAGTNESPSANAGGAAIYLGTLALTSLGIVLHQYLTRRTVRSLVLGVAGLASANVAGTVAVLYLPAATIPPSDEAQLTRDLEITLDGVERTTRRSPLHLRLEFRTEGAPPGYAVLWHGSGQQILEWPSGRQDVSGANVLDQASTAESIAALLASPDATPTRPGMDQRFTMFFRIPNAAIDLLDDGAPRYRLNATLKLVEPHLIAIGPAVPGTQLQRDGHRIRVVESTLGGQTFELLTVETVPANLQSEISGAGYLSQLKSTQTIQLFLSGPNANVIDSVPVRRDVRYTVLRIAGVQVAWRNTHFNLSDDLPQDLDKSSVDAWTLGALYVEPKFTIKRSVVVESFPIPKH